MTERPAAAALAEAATAAGYAPSIHNTQPWRWLVHDDVLDLYADRSRALPVADPDGRLLTISCGTAVHHCLVALAADSWAADVDRIPDPADPDLLARIRLTETTPVNADAMHMFQNLRLRHTDRRPVSSTALDPNAVESVRRAATAPGIDVQVLTAEQVDALGSACARADAIEAADASQRLELAYWVGGERAAGTGMGPEVIPADMPSGAVPGRDFVRTGTLPARGESEGAATYLMLFGSGDEPVDWLQAGEALSAAWLTATGLGLSVLPFSSVIEVAVARESLRQSVLAGLGEPYLVVRLGNPDPEHGLTARTPRLPAEQTVSFA
jgi:nitroreductase